MDVEFMYENIQYDISYTTKDEEKMITTNETTERSIRDINIEYSTIKSYIRELEIELEEINMYFKNIKEIEVFFMNLPFGIGASAVTYLSLFQSTFDFSTIAILVSLSVAIGGIVSWGSTVISCKLFPNKIQNFLIKHSFQLETVHNKILELRNEISRKKDRLIELDVEIETLNSTFVNKEKLFYRRKEKIEEFNKLFIQNLRLCNHVDYEDVTEHKKRKKGRRLTK